MQYIIVNFTFSGGTAAIAFAETKLCDLDCILTREMPIIGDIFRIHSKIGFGTFGSVYLASLKQSSSNSELYAIKHINSYCSPKDG